MQLCLAFFLITIKNKYTIMGRGDIKTKRGKIAAGSFGKARPSKVEDKVAAPKAEKVAKPAKKAK
jgi:30S ribosomal protein S31